MHKFLPLFAVGILACGDTGGLLIVEEAPEYTCHLRGACPESGAACTLVQCFDADGTAPPESWSPDDSCDVPENVAAAQVCGAQRCCSKVPQ